MVTGSPCMSKPLATTRSARRAVEGQVRDRQAALRAVLLLLGQVQRRVDQVAELAVDVPGEHPQADADLRRGQPGAGRLEHRVGEVRDQPAQLLVEVGDRRRPGCAAPGPRTDGSAGRPRGRSSRGRGAVRRPAAPVYGVRTASLEADRVDLDPHRRQLAGRRARPASRPGRATARRRGAGHPDHDAQLRRVLGSARAGADRHRAEHLGAGAAARSARQRRPPRRPRAGQRGQPGGRRQVRRPPLGELAAGEAGRVPADQRLQRRVGGLARPRPPGRPAGRAGPGPPRRATGAGPPRRCAGRCGPASARCRAAPRRRSRPPRPAPRPGWPRRSRIGLDRGQHPVAAGGAHRHRRERPADLLGGALRLPAPVPAGPRPPHSAQCQAGRRVPHHRQDGGWCGGGRRSGPVQTGQRAGVRHRSQARVVT